MHSYDMPYMQRQILKKDALVRYALHATTNIKKGCTRTICPTCNDKFRDVRNLEEQQRKHDAKALTKCISGNKKFIYNRD